MAWPAAPGAIALAALLAAATAGAQTLRYAPEAGQTDRYRLSNTVRIHQEFQGTATDLTVRSSGLVRVELDRAGADTLTYGVTFDSLDLSFEGAPFPPPDLSPLVGRRMTLALSPRGDVHAFTLPGNMPAPPQGFDLEQMVTHFFPRLPEQAAAPGTTWSDTLRFPIAQQGIESSVQVLTDYTARGETREGGRSFLQVDYATRTTISGSGDQAGAPLVLDGKGTGSGTILFDAEGSTFWSSRGTQQLELVVDVRPEGQPPMSIPIHQETTSEIQHR